MTAAAETRHVVGGARFERLQVAPGVTPPWFWIFAAALLLAVIIVYQPVWMGGFIWDDAAHVTRPDLRSWEGLRSIWFVPGATQQYYPVTHSFFWLLHRLFGDAAPAYHLVTIALHGIGACLVAMILHRIAVPGAFLAAAIFALHPVHVESVAWISEIKNTLSACFCFGATLAWLAYLRTRKPAMYVVSIGFFMLALGSKSVTATLPGVLLVIAWWRHGTVSWRRDVMPLVPFFAFALAAALTTIWVERSLVGAQGTEFEFGLRERLLIAGRALWFYAGKLAWPADLVFTYPRWTISATTWWQYLYPVAALAVLGIVWAMRYRTRGPLAGILVFIGVLFPALGFFNAYPFLFSFVADHFQYLASLGLITLAAGAIVTVLEHLHLRGTTSGATICLALLTALALLTWRQSHMYADVELLYRTTLERNPDSWMAHNNLAGVLIARGSLDEALPHVEKALALRPDYAEALNNLGLVLASRGRTEEAVARYRRALDLQPTYAEAHNNLGVLLARVGDADAALVHFRRALEIDPRLAGAHYNLANVLAGRGQTSEAIESLRRATAYRPDYAEAHNRLGIMLADRGDIEDARRHFSAALEIQPTYAEARNNLGIALAREGHFDAAIGQFQRALEDDPASSGIRQNLEAAVVARNRAQRNDRQRPSPRER